MEFTGRPRRNTDPPVVVSEKDFPESEPKRRRHGSVGSKPQDLDKIRDALRPIFPNVIKERKLSRRRKDTEPMSHLSKTGILKFIPLGRQRPDKSFNTDNPIDSLIERMQESFHIIDTVQTVPVHVRIPDVYQLSMASYCEEFFERREQPDIIPYRKGFQASALVKSGALDYANLQECDLDNPIHPIFQENNWTDTPAHIYQTIQPALRLATKFLTTPYCMQYWLTLLRGNREYCTFTSAIYKAHRNRISRDVPLTPSLARATINDLISLAPSIDLQFHNLTSEVYGKTNGHNCHVSHTHLQTETSHAKPFVKPHIHIHTDFYTAAQKISETRFPDRAQVLRFSLFLAVLLLHELAHVVEMTQQPPHNVGRQEDFVYGHPIAEAGRAWEMQMLGGVLEPINVRCDALNGLAVKDWPAPACRGIRDLERPADGREFVTVNMRYVGQMFRKSFWRGVETAPLDAHGLLYIPRDGVLGVGAPMCSTAKDGEFEVVEGSEERLKGVLRDILSESIKVGDRAGVRRCGRSRVSKKRDRKIGLGCSRRLIRARC